MALLPWQTLLAKLCSSALWTSESLLILKITHLKVRPVLLAVSRIVQARVQLQCCEGCPCSSDLGHAGWMLSTIPEHRLCFTGQVSNSANGSVLSPTPPSQESLVSVFPKPTSQDPLRCTCSFLKACSNFACLNYPQGYPRCPLTELILGILMPN